MSIELSFLSDPQVGGISLDNFCEGVFPISAAFEGAPKETECKPPSKAAFRKFAAEHGAGARRNLAEMQLEASNATAPMQNNQELAQILMKYGKNKYGWSALNYAINCEDYHAAIILINNGADCFFRDKNNYNIHT